MTAQWPPWRCRWLGWLLGKDGVTAPLIGAAHVRHIDDAVGALDVRLDDPEIARLAAPPPPACSVTTRDRHYQDSMSLVAASLPGPSRP